MSWVKVGISVLVITTAIAIIALVLGSIAFDDSRHVITTNSTQTTTILTADDRLVLQDGSSVSIPDFVTSLSGSGLAPVPAVAARAVPESRFALHLNSLPPMTSMPQADDRVAIFDTLSNTSRTVAVDMLVPPGVYVPLAGGVMTGDLVGGAAAVNLGTPAGPFDSVCAQQLHGPTGSANLSLAVADRIILNGPVEVTNTIAYKDQYFYSSGVQVQFPLTLLFNTTDPRVIENFSNDAYNGVSITSGFTFSDNMDLVFYNGQSPRYFNMQCTFWHSQAAVISAFYRFQLMQITPSLSPRLFGFVRAPSFQYQVATTVSGIVWMAPGDAMSMTVEAETPSSTLYIYSQQFTFTSVTP